MKQNIFFVALVMALMSCSITTDDAGAKAPDSEVRMNIEPGSLQETAVRDGWKLDMVDVARSAADLTSFEKDVILALNMVRLDPVRYAELYIKPILTTFNGRIRVINGKTLRTDEGRIPAEELYEYLIHHIPVAPLAYSPDLHRSAVELSFDQSKTGKIGHITSIGRSYDVRIRSNGRWKSGVAEAIGYGGKTGFDMVNNLLIDDGLKDRGDRLIIMDSLYHYAGVSVKTHSDYGSIAVIDFAVAIADKIKGSK